MIAIIGMACRFPGARNIPEFWEVLREGRETLTRVSKESLLAAGIPASICEDPAYVPVAGLLEGIEYFDENFFGFSPREASLLDPQQRLFIECAWEALENAGCPTDDAHRRTGVFAGVGYNQYALRALTNQELARSPSAAFQLMLANDNTFMATRVSHRFDLRGPSVGIQTACSTSLVAVHLACQSLWNYECETAIAGGVTIRFPHAAGYLYEPGNIASPDGHCRAFDALAQGTVFGSGSGVVILRRLEDALADGDRILALIRGSAINNDGADKIGYTAPSLNGQTSVISEALAMADVGAETIEYVEAHGTGTELGDPVEVKALTAAFQQKTQKVGFCALGSVKTNFGHLDVASGVAGLIKVVLMLQHGAMPASLHYKTPNPEIDFAAGPFYVNATFRDWEGGKSTPRRAGVSSFGIGGTNAHVILEEAPVVSEPDRSHPAQVLVISAKTQTALDRLSRLHAEHLRANPELNLADVAWTLQNGRRRFKHRRVAVCKDVHEALRELAEHDSGNGRPFEKFRCDEHTERPVLFLFPGQGTERVGMSQGLFRDEPVFQKVVNRCAELLKPALEYDIRDLLYPTEALMPWAVTVMSNTAAAQPALFVVEYALAELWQEWGVRPTGVIGHSLGELVAACVAGVLSLEEALNLIVIRGKLMQAMPEGSMIAVSAPEADVRPMLTKSLSIAAVNSYSACVVSGPSDEVGTLEANVGVKNTRRLETRRAFHSAMMKPAASEFAARLRGAVLAVPSIPISSCVTGTWLENAEATDPDFWAHQLVAPVRFADAVGTVLESQPAAILIEVGPGRVLSGFVRTHPCCPKDPTIVPTLSRATADMELSEMLKAVGQIWLSGGFVDWRAVHTGERRHKLALPTYPFERKHHWISGPVPSTSLIAPPCAQPTVEIMAAQVDILTHQLRVLNQADI